MRNYLSRGVAAVGFALSALAAVFTVPAFALTSPPTFAPRQFPSQQVHYERHVVTITSSGCSADGGPASAFSSGSCNIKVGALPYNAFVLRGNWFQATACNAGTTCTLSLGTASGGAQLVSAQDIKSAATGAPALTIVTAGQGAQVTGNGTTPSGTDGGFDLWVNIAQTGTAATAGTIVFDLEYLGANDGGCTQVPIGSTASAC
jgi:hypothetical protein